MDVEPILIKLGLDGSSLATGLRSLKQKLGEFSEAGEKTFLHVGTAGRAFHKVLEQMTEASPMLGNALRFALNPIVGTLLAATSAFSYFKGKLDEWNAQMDEQEQHNAKAQTDIGEIRRKVAKELDDERQSFEKWQKSIKDAASVTVDALTDELRIIEATKKALDAKSDARAEQAKKDIEGRTTGDDPRLPHHEADVKKEIDTENADTTRKAELRQHEKSALQQEIAAREKAMSDLKKQNDTAERSAEASHREAANGTSATVRAKREEEQGNLERDMPRLEGQRDKAKKAYDALSPSTQHQQEYLKSGKFKELDEADKALKSAKARLDTIKDTKVAEDAYAKKVAEAEDEAKKKVQQTADAYEKLNIEQKDARTKLNTPAEPIPITDFSQKLKQAKAVDQKERTKIAEEGADAYRSTLGELAHQGDWITTRGPGGARGNIRGRYWQPTAIGAFASQLERDKNWMANMTARGAFTDANGNYDAKKAMPYLKNIHDREEQLKRAGLLKRGPEDIWNLLLSVTSNQGGALGTNSLRTVLPVTK